VTTLFVGSVTPMRARALLAAWIVIALTASLLEIRQTPVPAARSVRTAAGDVALFRAVMARVRAGEPYHRALAAELRPRKYPTASVFNWRTPALYRLTGFLYPDAVRALLVGLGGLVLVATGIAMKARSAPALAGALFLQLGAVVTVMVPSAPLMTEAWAGMLLALSICAYQLRAWRTAAFIGMLALFVRELAAPYVVVCALLAVRRRRWAEVTIWVAGALMYFMYYWWHVHEVWGLQQPGDLAHAQSWLYGGGPAFLLRTLRTNAWLLVSPGWLPSASFLLATLIAACLSGQTAPHLRLTVLTYLSLFLVVGQPFNDYWGLLTAPIWALAAADGVDALRTWAATARRRSAAGYESGS
jgi:hypothetical protein